MNRVQKILTNSFIIFSFNYFFIVIFNIQFILTCNDQYENIDFSYKILKESNIVLNDLMTNIFPLHLIKVAENTNIMAELKSGETYNGILKGVDKFMNIKLEDAILTDKNGQVFHQVKEVYIRGNALKYFTFDDDLISKIEGTKYVCPQKWKKASFKDVKRRKINKGN